MPLVSVQEGLHEEPAGGLWTQGLRPLLSPPPGSLLADGLLSAVDRLHSPPGTSQTLTEDARGS